MIRLKIDFIKDLELKEFVNHIESNYEIVEKSAIKDSKKKDSKYRTQYIDVINKEIA